MHGRFDFREDIFIQACLEKEMPERIKAGMSHAGGLELN